MSITTQTPIDVLDQHVRILHKTITKLEARDDINPDTTEQQITEITDLLRLRIIEFERAKEALKLYKQML